MANTQISFSFEEEPVHQKPLKKNDALSQQEIVLIKPDKVKSTRGRKSLKDGEASAGKVNVPEDDVLFKKMYYPIGVVAEMFGVNPSLLRFWENEFDILHPKKNGKGDRLFRPEDIRNLKLIFHLLRERKYTIEGAKDFLKKSRRSDEKFTVVENLKKLKGFLLEMKAGL